MPDGMPFMKQKGSHLVNVDQLALTRETVLNLLVAMHDESVEVAGALVTEKAINETVAGHIREDWFGMYFDPMAGAWQPQPEFGATHPITGEKVVRTGFWSNWYGDVESIVRVAIIRVAERMLGLDPIDYPQQLKPGSDAEIRALYNNPTSDGDLNTSLEVWWCCPMPRFEAMVEASLDDVSTHPKGTVRLEFFTPAPEFGVLGSGYRGSDPTSFVAPGVPKPSSIGSVFSIVGSGGPPRRPSPDGQLESGAYVITPQLSESWIVGQDEVKAHADEVWLKLEGFTVEIFNPLPTFVGSGPPATVDVRVPFGGTN